LKNFHFSFFKKINYPKHIQLVFSKDKKKEEKRRKEKKREVKGR